AGPLSRRDAERVERALATDRDLAIRFELVREELAETIHLNESLGAPSARAMEKLFAAIDAESALKRKPGFAFDLRARAAEFFAGFAPRTLAYASGAAALVILLQAGVIGSMMLKDNADFGVASYDRPTKVDGIDFYVNFAPTATVDEISKFLRDHEAKIVEGPKGERTYQVHFPVTGVAKDEAARLSKEMQQSRNLILSEFEVPNAGK